MLSSQFHLLEMSRLKNKLRRTADSTSATAQTRTVATTIVILLTRYTPTKDPNPATKLTRKVQRIACCSLPPTNTKATNRKANSCTKYPILMSILPYCLEQVSSCISQVDGMIVKVEGLGEEEKGRRRSIF